MITAIKHTANYAKATVHGWFQRTFKEQAGGAEVIATLVIIAIVLALALIFKDNLANLVSTLWDNMMGKKDPQTGSLPSWDSGK